MVRQRTTAKPGERRRDRERQIKIRIESILSHCKLIYGVEWTLVRWFGGHFAWWRAQNKLHSTPSAFVEAKQGQQLLCLPARLSPLVQFYKFECELWNISSIWRVQYTRERVRLEGRSDFKMKVLREKREKNWIQTAEIDCDFMWYSIGTRKYYYYVFLFFACGRLLWTERHVLWNGMKGNSQYNTPG